jgi:hypothetical protein
MPQRRAKRNYPTCIDPGPARTQAVNRRTTSLSETGSSSDSDHRTTMTGLAYSA